MGFTKTLTFTYNNLPQEGYLIFTFDDEKIIGHAMYKDFFPVVWKVAHLQTGGEFEFTETYTQQLAFATGEVENGKVKTSSAIRDVDFKQITTLSGDATKGYTWSAPVTDNKLGETRFTATNGTDKKQNIIICSDPDGSGFVQPLLYTTVAKHASCNAVFTGRLRIYSVSDMQEGQLISSEVTSEKLWDYPIASTSTPDNWVITYNDDTGNYEINAAGSN